MKQKVLINTTKFLTLGLATTLVLVIVFAASPKQQGEVSRYKVAGINDSPEATSTPLNNEQSGVATPTADLEVSSVANPTYKSQQLTPVVVSELSNTAGKITDYKLQDIKNDASIISYKLAKKTFAYAFTWEEGKFSYSWDNSLFIPAVKSIDGSDEKNSKLATDLMFDQKSDTVYIKAENVKGLKLHLFDDAGNASGEFSLAATPLTKYRGATYTKLNIRSREQWGADESKALWLPRYAKISRMMIHHTAGSNSSTNYDAVVRSIYNYHAVTLDWADIGYNYLVAPNGTIYEGRQGGEGPIAAHTYQYNTGSIGIALIGTYSSVMPDGAAFASLKRLIAEKSVIHNIPVIWGSTLFGHRDFNQTECPGDMLYNRMPDLIDQIVGFTANYPEVVTALNDANAAFSALDPRESNSSGNLIVTFDRPESTPESEIRQLIPIFSGIEDAGVIGNKAYLGVTHYYSANVRQFWRTKLLYALFKLDPNVLTVEYAPDYSVPEGSIVQ